MKMLHLTLAILVVSVLLAEPATAQTRTSTTQTVTLAVNAIYKLNVTGTPILSITDGAAGSGNFTSVSDAGSAYALTQNVPTARLSVQLSPSLPTGQSLSISVPNGLGTTAGTVLIGDGAAHNIVTGLARGAVNGQTITYTYGASTSADPMTATNFTVTWTLAD
jgi:hypothetical protein